MNPSTARHPPSPKAQPLPESTPAEADGQPHSGGEGFELWFGSLFSARAMVFRCDQGGHVDLDALSDRARTSYLAARALIGREFAYPVVRPALH